jgi:hypothetical protein
MIEKNACGAEGLAPPRLEQILERVYAPESSGTGKKRVYVISANGEIRWLIDSRAVAGLNVIWRDWKPYSWKSRMAWGAVRQSARFHILGLVPGVRSIESVANELKAPLRNFLSVQGAWPVILVGKPSVTAKLILFMVTRAGEVVSVAKLPLTSLARKSILAEAQVLQQLGDKLDGIPALLDLDTHTGSSVQSWTPGASLGRQLSQKQIAFLLSLPRSGEQTAIEALFQEALSNLPKEQLVRCEQLILRFKDAGSVTRIWEHGDFVPWNMKEFEGGITMVDWEYARAAGAPLVDLCHFLYRQAFLFGDIRDVPAEIARNPFVKQYRAALGLDDEQMWALQMLYLVRALATELPDSKGGEKYTQFLFRHMEAIAAKSAGFHL